jgi:hypothetical protein
MRVMKTLVVTPIIFFLVIPFHWLASLLASAGETSGHFRRI